LIEILRKLAIAVRIKAIEKLVLVLMNDKWMARRRFTDVEVGIVVIKFAVEIVKMFKAIAITTVVVVIRDLSIRGYLNVARELIH